MNERKRKEKERIQKERNNEKDGLQKKRKR